MSDEALPDVDRLNAARKDLFEILGRYADGWSNTEGGVVVSYIAVVEILAPDGERGWYEVRGGGPDGQDDINAITRIGLLYSALTANG